jgi:hypothetical protein
VSVTKKNRIVVMSLLVATTSSIVNAGPRDQAKKLFSSLTGNTPNKKIADKYEQKIKSVGVKAAAKEMVEGNYGFYNVTLRNFYTPMSNEDGTQFAPLNDMTTTLIGATRDEIDFFRVFWDDVFYKFDAPLINNTSKNNFKNSSGSGLNANSKITIVDGNGATLSRSFNQLAPTNDWMYFQKYDTAVRIYNPTKNDQYLQSETMNIPLSDRDVLKSSQQLTYTTGSQGAIAGIFSTRGWAKAYYEAGTNRAAFAYFAKNFLCLEMEELNDTTVPDFRVRRDVDRAPGGKAETYKTFCVGCHAGQDALGGAFSYYDYVEGKMKYAEHHDANNNVVGPVAPKINHNNVFPDGKITQSDSWLNLWNEGQNSYIGWGGATSGNGVKSLGKMFAETKQVRTCLAKQVFKTVCYRSPSGEEDKETITSLADNFDEDNNMKNLFINAAISCAGK